MPFPEYDLPDIGDIVDSAICEWTKQELMCLLRAYASDAHLAKDATQLEKEEIQMMRGLAHIRHTLEVASRQFYRTSPKTGGIDWAEPPG